MSDDLSSSWMADWPLLNALSAAHHELRMPLVSMRGALQLIVRFYPSAPAEAIIAPLLAQVNQLSDQLDRLFELHIRIARLTGAATAGSESHLIADVNVAVAQLRQATVALRQLAPSPDPIGNMALTEEAQRLFALFLTGQERWQGAIETLLDPLVRRVQHMER